MKNYWLIKVLNILGEEFSYQRTDSEFKWIIDPLDMTKNFVHGVPFFSNFIALERNSKIIAGVIYMPVMKILAYAAVGRGAFVNGKRARTSDTKDLSKAYVVFGDIDKKGLEPFSKQFFNLVESCAFGRGYGDALGYILLAQGHVDIFFDRGKPWDVAPGKILVEEAGGKVTDFDGKDNIYSGNSISTNGNLHDKVVEILRK